MGDVIANIRIDERLESYRTFFDHQWAKDILKLVAGTKLEPQVDSLTIHWKSVANAHVMPWLVTEALKNLAEGYVLAGTPFAVQLVDVMKLRLANEIGDALPPRHKKIVKAAVDRVAEDVRATSAVAKEDAATRMRSTDIWAEFSRHPEFGMSIWGSQRLCYAGVYFGYESFVRACASLAIGKPTSDDWTRSGELLRDLKAVFGEQIVNDYVADRTVNVARLVRNALVHHGGKVTEELRHISHGLAVEDGVLQIMAPDTSKLFDQLKGRALKLAQRAVELPAIK